MILLLHWLLSALSLILVTYLVPGFTISSFYSALLAALVLGLVNLLVRPIILLLTLPINLLTLGLFTLVINALMLWLVASIVKGFNIDNFTTAFWSALILWLINWLLNHIIDR